MCKNKSCNLILKFLCHQMRRLSGMIVSLNEIKKISDAGDEDAVNGRRLFISSRWMYSVIAIEN